MSNTASPLAQELLSGHVLMMQCGASALRILDRTLLTDVAQFDLPAGDEAVRMAGLSAGLMRYHTTGVRLLHRLPPEARAGAPVPAVQPASGATAEAAAAVRKLHADPGVRRGRLQNGNPCGNYLKSPRCGARTRAGGGCRQPAMASPGGGRGRCRMHGGLSTGPRTPEGLARCRAARLVPRLPHPRPPRPAPPRRPRRPPPPLPHHRTAPVLRWAWGPSLRNQKSEVRSQNAVPDRGRTHIF